MDTWNDVPHFAFDQDFAEGFIGKYLLVGITRTGNKGKVLSQQQLHGIIVNATAQGIELELGGVHEGKTWRMPPILEELAPARRGKYELKTTGEVVEDPDFTFTLTMPTTRAAAYQ
ncbi:hypothetical protein [Undibacterium sp. Ren11W]|uniref:hypothetical protein n=1 Tax=Undibacterium sp. Ren11W TaxID=3413045 RepID=UPI003BF2A3AF